MTIYNIYLIFKLTDFLGKKKMKNSITLPENQILLRIDFDYNDLSLYQ